MRGLRAGSAEEGEWTVCADRTCEVCWLFPWDDETAAEFKARLKARFTERDRTTEAP